MTQPLKQIGPLLAVATVARAGLRFLKSRPLAACAAIARALWHPASLVLALGLIVYTLLYAVPYVGALAQRWLGSPPVYYLIPTHPVPEAALRRWASASFSRLDIAQGRRDESIEHGASFFTLDEEERSRSLADIEALMAQERREADAREEAALRRETLSLLRSLRSGKSLQAALDQLPPPPPEASTQTRSDLLAFQRALRSAKTLNAGDIPAHERLIPRFLTSASARPQGWAWHQTYAFFPLLGIGMASLAAILVMVLIIIAAVETARAALKERQDQLREEWDRQSVEGSTESAKAPSKPTRL